uniref:Fatty-acid and retinol-binding protein 1 n=1 Tax=Panagrellus redivivus TaxID=6233 RepID=A0A7E4V2V9_PANRE
MFGRSAITILCIVAGYAVALQDVKDFFLGLTYEDDQILSSVFKYKQYDNFDQALDALKAKSEKLHDKVFRLRNLVTKSVEKLEDDDAKKFVKKTFKTIASTLPAVTERNDAVVMPVIFEILNEFKSLSSKSKSSLKKVFPVVTGYLESRSTNVSDLN